MDMLAVLTARNELSRLADARLFREQAYVGGHWTAARNGRVIDVTNPATGERLGVVPALGAAETEAAIAAAAEAFPAWRRKLPQERAALLRCWYDLMVEAREDLALLMTLEQGKPLAEARGEIDYAASFIEWFAEEAKRVNVEGVTPHLPGRQMLRRRLPPAVRWWSGRRARRRTRRLHSPSWPTAPAFPRACSRWSPAPRSRSSTRC
jgi:aspartate-semialdehyde dehydrogenase